MAEFTERCRAGGLAVTPQRLAIIEALFAANDHPRAERIFDDVRRRHPHISLATVHRTLETLCAIGEARKVTCSMTARATTAILTRIIMWSA